MTLEVVHHDKPLHGLSMKQTTITAVLFDWDLTLAYALGDVTYSQRLTALFKSVGLHFSQPEVSAAIEEVMAGTDPSFPAQMPPQTRRDIIQHYFRILRKLGVHDRSWKFGNELYDAYSSLPTYLYEDTLPLLKALQQQGYVMGIISNHATSARALIEQLVGEWIPSRHIIISQDFGVHKPAKSIFRRSLQQLRASTGQCAFVGNSLTVDAVAAVEQGGFQLGLWLDREGDGRNQTLPDRVYRITTLAQVLDYV